MKKRKSLGTLVAIAVIGGLVISNSIILLLSNGIGAGILRQAADDEIVALTKEVAESADDKLENELKILETMADSPAFTDRSYSFARKANYAMGVAKKLGYRVFFLIDKDGKGQNLDEEKKSFDLSSREYFIEAMKGNRYISDVVKDLVTGKPIVIMAVPIIRDGKAVSVLAGVKEIGFISSIGQGMDWKESEVVVIYDNNGLIIGHTQPEYADGTQNVVELAKEDDIYRSVAGFYTDRVQKEEYGYGNYEFKGQQNLAGFYTMKNKDWKVMISVNEYEVLAPQRKLMMLLLAVILFITLTMAGLLYFGVTRRLTKSFQGMKENIEHLASLNLADDLPHDSSNYKTELGDIYFSILSVRENMTNMVKQIRSSIDKLTASSQDFSKSCAAASIMANDITRTVDEIAQGASEQAGEVQGGVNDLEAMGEQMERNTAQMEDMVEASDRVDALQQEGSRQIESLMASTQDSIQISLQIREAIRHTEQSVAEIHGAGETIQSISEQINLLALNAAIEAARAGEAGKGFAVVADEIRKLAESSGKSTAQIQQSVRTLSERTGYAVSQIEASESIVEAQSQNVEVMNQKFRGISEALSVLRETIDRIFEANNRINEARVKVSGVMTSVAALTEENAASTQEIAASMQEQKETFEMIATESEALLELGEDLERIVQEFKLGER